MAGLRRHRESEEGPDFQAPTTFVRTIPVRDWVRTMRRLLRSRPLHVRVDTSHGFRHPWHVRPRWSPARSRWEIEVNPGYVNARETLVHLPAKEAPEATRQRLGLDPAAKERVDAWLSETPSLPIPPSLLRPIGEEPEGLGGERVPEVFRAYGVGAEEYDVSLDLEALSHSVSLTGAMPDASERRWLRSIELVLVQPRPALRLSLGLEESGPGLQLEVDVPADERPHLSLRRAWSGDAPVEGVEQLALGATDTALDEKHLATIYFLSPLGADPGRPPDFQWEPWVQHRTWWNLRHEVNQFLEALPERRLTFPGLGLAGGVGDALISGTVMANDAALAEAQALLNRSRIEGRFWSV